VFIFLLFWKCPWGANPTGHYKAQQKQGIRLVFGALCAR